MKLISKAAAIGVVALATLLPVTGAHAAEVTCKEGEHPNGNTDPNAPYCSPDTPDEGGQDDNGGVSPDEHEKPPTDVDSGGGQTVAPEEGPSAIELPRSDTAPSGSLPFTGGDVVALTIIGAGALGLGTVLVRRSKAAKTEA